MCSSPLLAPSSIQSCTGRTTTGLRQSILENTSRRDPATSSRNITERDRSFPLPFTRSTKCRSTATYSETFSWIRNHAANRRVPMILRFIHEIIFRDTFCREKRVIHPIIFFKINRRCCILLFNPCGSRRCFLLSSFCRKRTRRSWCCCCCYLRLSSGFSLLAKNVFVAFSRLRGFKRRNFFERSTLQRPGNESISKYIFAVSSSTWLASIVRETFNEQ